MSATRDLAFDIASECLSFDFVGNSVDECQEESGSLHIPTSWRVLIQAGLDTSGIGRESRSGTSRDRILAKSTNTTPPQNGSDKTEDDDLERTSTFRFVAEIYQGLAAEKTPSTMKLLLNLSSVRRSIFSSPEFLKLYLHDVMQVNKYISFGESVYVDLSLNISFGESVYVDLSLFLLT